MYGAWFGRPMDNIHKPIRCSESAEMLTIHFDQGEVLELKAPSEPIINGNSLVIESAEWIRFSWYSYGEPKTESNKYFHLYEVQSGKVTYSTSSPWEAKPNTISPALAIR